MQHLVDYVGSVLGCLELDLPSPVQEVGAGRLTERQNTRVVFCHLVERLSDREGEHAAGVGVHQALADVILNRRVIGYAQANVNVTLARRVALSDVDRAHRDAAPDR